MEAINKKASRVLIVSNDVISDSMAGPGIRYWEIAKVLARQFSVVLSAPSAFDRTISGVQIEGYVRTGGLPDDRSIARLKTLVGQADAILLSGSLLRQFPFLASLSIPLIVDLYVPYFLENLELFSCEPGERRREIHSAGLEVLWELLTRGDFFLCASDRQRDLMVGLLIAANRVNPLTYAQDRMLHQLVAVVPFGLDGRLPQHRERALKGAYPGIEEADKVILWGGGVWQWLDPLTLITAMSEVVQQMPRAKLFFLGTKHPNRDDAPDTGMLKTAVALSKELGLLDQHVFFNDWVPYDRRSDYLLEADVGVSLHFDCLETRFAFRTRILDYIWAGLPMVVSRGDCLSEIVERHQIGRVVEPGDVEAVAFALLELLSLPDLRSVFAPRFTAVSKELTWERAVEPLVQYLACPTVAADRQHDEGGSSANGTANDPVALRLVEREAEIARLKGLIKGYESGRVLKALNTMGRLRQRVWGERQ